MNNSGGTERWYDEYDNLHRPDGLPAVVDDEGYEGYYNHGAIKYWIWKGKKTSGEDFEEET